MSDRIYRLNLAKDQEALQEVAEAFSGASYWDMRLLDEEQIQEMMSEFVSSSVFKERLTRDEQRRSMGAAAACFAAGTWKYTFKNVSDGLFEATVPNLSVAAEPEDALVLSGALGWSHDDGELLDMAAELDYSVLDVLRIAGASANNFNEAALPYGKYSVSAGGIITEQYVGADVHGDFRARRIVASDHVVVAPNGEYVPFAPLVSHAETAAYHSTEMSIVSGMLAYLFHDKPAHEISKLKKRMLLDAPDQDRLLPPFGDFGDESRHVRYYAQKQGRDFEIGDSLAQLRISPDNEHIYLDLIAESEGVVFRTVRKDADDQPQTAGEMTIPTDEIGLFIAAMVGAGQGRVAAESIRELIAIF